MNLMMDLLNPALSISILAPLAAIAILNATQSNKRKALQEERPGEIRDRLLAARAPEELADVLIKSIGEYADSKLIHKELYPIMTSQLRVFHFLGYSALLIVISLYLRFWLPDLTVRLGQALESVAVQLSMWPVYAELLCIAIGAINLILAVAVCVRANGLSHLMSIAYPKSENE